MKVTLLGTASAEGMPGLFCRCMTCDRIRAAGGKNLRTRSSALIDGQLKIDFPPDILTQANRNNVDLSRIDAILFTHGHDDHFSPAQLQYRGKYFVETPLTNQLDLFGPRDVVEQLKCALDPTLVAYSLSVLEPEIPATVLGYEVFPFHANHDDTRICLNYILKAPDGVTLLYASDTGWYPDSIWKLLEQFRFDGVVVECAKRDEGGYPGHLSIPEVIRMREHLEATGSLCPGAPMVTTHFSHHMGLLHEEIDALLMPHGIQAGYDGITIDVEASH